MVTYAYSTRDGSILWDFDTVQDYKTVNGVKGMAARSTDQAPVVVNGMVFVNSGYMRFGGAPGNVAGLGILTRSLRFKEQPWVGSLHSC